MNKLITFWCGVGLLAIPASALEMNLTPGSLTDNYVEFRNTSDPNVKLSGQADVRDLMLLKNISNSVVSIDLSDLEITSYSFPEGDYMGLTSFESGELPAYILSGCAIKSITLPKSLKSIGTAAFVGSMIESIEFPESLQSIGDYAFANSEHLSKAVFNSDANIGIGVFKDCKQLKDFVVNYPITEIPESMFAGCISFDSEIPSSVKSIGNYAFRGCGMHSVNLVNVENIGDYSFADMPDLETVILGTNRDIKVGNGAFFNDAALALLPTFDTDMSKAVFAHTNALNNSLINSENIESAAFANNSILDSVYFGSNVKNIKSHAFRNDFALKLIDASRLKNNVPAVAEDAFSGLLNDEGRYDINLNVEAGSESNWQADPVWSLFNIGQFTVGVEDVVSDPVNDIRISRNANVVKVESVQPIEYVGIFALDGMVLHESMPGETSFVSSELPASGDVIIVKVISSGIEKISKLK